MRLDSESRLLSLPKRLVNFVKFNKKIFFIGKGFTFEIWGKRKFNIHYKKTRELAKKIAFLPEKKDAT